MLNKAKKSLSTLQTLSRTGAHHLSCSRSHPRHPPRIKAWFKIKIIRTLPWAKIASPGTRLCPRCPLSQTRLNNKSKLRFKGTSTLAKTTSPPRTSLNQAPALRSQSQAKIQVSPLALRNHPLALRDSNKKLLLSLRLRSLSRGGLTPKGNLGTPGLCSSQTTTPF